MATQEPKTTNQRKPLESKRMEEKKEHRKTERSAKCRISNWCEVGDVWLCVCVCVCWLACASVKLSNQVRNKTLRVKKEALAAPVNQKTHSAAVQPKTHALDLLQQSVITHVIKRQPVLVPLHIFTVIAHGIQRECQKQSYVSFQAVLSSRIYLLTFLGFPDLKPLQFCENSLLIVGKKTVQLPLIVCSPAAHPPLWEPDTVQLYKTASATGWIWGECSRSSATQLREILASAFSNCVIKMP